MNFLTVWEREGCVLKEVTLGGHPINNRYLALKDEFISRFIIMLTDLTISLWQEFFRWENWAIEKLNNLSRSRQIALLNSIRPVTSHSCVYTDSQTNCPLWRGEGPSFCQASFFQWTSDTHWYIHAHLHTHTRLLQSEVLEQTQHSVFYIQ